MIALTIDEVGMAKDADAKVKLAHRLYDFAVKQHGLPADDLIFDPLTFTICTGNEDDRKLAIETLDAIERIARELPECQIVLGLSNVSFGLRAPARAVLNSVFLDHAVKRGMTGAIVHVAKIVPLHKIPPEDVQIAEDLIFDRRRESYDPLQAFIALFEGREGTVKIVRARARDRVEERLKQRIVDGDRTGLEEDLNDALKTYPPLDIINTLLLDGMKMVGELFGSGQMQLPFVLQSAETMKAAVAFLEPHMERIDGQAKGTIVLATVKGDVHDIGKNLVDIILTNNGYRVVNLGIKQPIAAILAAAREHKADAVGMSGLLVKSTVVMRENLEEMTREGIDLPVMLGGAALTRAYVEEDCVSAYGPGRVAYARDAFDGLDLMGKVVEGRFDEHMAETKARRLARPSNERRGPRFTARTPSRPVDLEEIKLRRAELAKQSQVPTPPFWGPRTLEKVPLQTLVPYLNETMLYQFHWGYRKAGKRSRNGRNGRTRSCGRSRSTCSSVARRRTSSDRRRPMAIGNARAEGDRSSCSPRTEPPRWRASPFRARAARAGSASPISCATSAIGRARRDRPAGGHGGRRRERRGAPMVRREPLSGLSLSARPLGRDGRSDGRIRPHAHPRANSASPPRMPATWMRCCKQNYRGSRYSFGYPACPKLEDQAPLLRSAGRRGDRASTLTDEWQLDPEQSTSAIVILHPQAKYFTI